MALIFKSSGAGILEALIALVVISMSALALINLMGTTQITTKENADQHLCQAQLELILHQLDLPPGSFKARPFLPFLTTRFAPLPAPGEIGNEKGVSETLRWPQTPAYSILTQGPQPSLLNSHLLLGGLPTLLAIYNSDPAGFCTQPRGKPYVDNDGLFVPYRGNNGAATEMRLRIQPYELISGRMAPDDFACPPAPLVLRPKGADGIAPGALSPGGEFRVPASSADHLGVRLTLEVQSLNTNRDSINCRLSKQYILAPDNRPPPAPLFRLVTNSTPGPVCTASTLNQYEVTLETPNQSESGSVLLCRDRSQRLAPVCSPVPLPPAQVLGTNTWIPCDQMRVCGQPAESVTLTWTPQRQPRLRLRYRNLPVNCGVSVDAIAVDPAANRSLPTRLNGLIAAPPGNASCGCP